MTLIVLSSGLTEHYFIDWLPGQLINGIGMVAALTGLVGAALTALPTAQFALASGVNAALRQVGGAFGVALAVAIASGVGGQHPVIDGHAVLRVATGGFFLATLPALLMRHSSAGSQGEPAGPGPSEREAIEATGLTKTADATVS